MFFSISLAEWSLNKALFGKELDNLDFPAYAKERFGISAVEYVNQFFPKNPTPEYLNDLKKRCDDNGVESVLIMVDREGSLGDQDGKERIQAVDNHIKWLEAAKALGCHSIRVNAAGRGSREELAKTAADGLRLLSEKAVPFGLNVIVENHGGWSSDASWLSGVISDVGMDNCGTLPDFGNFCIKRGKDGCEEEYDKYLGIEELMPYAKGVSAKSYRFDAEGNEVDMDYVRILKTVKAAGYRGFIGIEYEGDELSADEGIIATKKLLEKAGSLV